jgi:hypothetical protein
MEFFQLGQLYDWLARAEDVFDDYTSTLTEENFSLERQTSR